MDRLACIVVVQLTLYFTTVVRRPPAARQLQHAHRTGAMREWCVYATPRRFNNADHEFVLVCSHAHRRRLSMATSFPGAMRPLVWVVGVLAILVSSGALADLGRAAAKRL
jgi:hypothetical protein